MPLDQVSDENDDQEMSFLDHLEELRWHIVRSFIAICVFSIIAFISVDFVFGVVIMGPSKVDFWTYRVLCQLSDLLNTTALCIDNLPFSIQSRQMTGQFTMHLTSSFFIGLILAFPYAFWEIWRFIKPGLYPKERKAARGATFFVSLLFSLGVAFGYFLVVPISINFLANYQLDPSILNEFDIVSYVNTVVMLVFSCAILFQLPIVVYFAAKAGIVSSGFLVKYRRHSMVGILILAAILTPPDPFSQILVAIPLFLLYEVSIRIAKRIEKKEAALDK